MPKPYTDLERELAKKRALKFEKLFKSDVFDDIVNAAGANDKPTFLAAVVDKKKALGPEDAEWLWNYLKEINSNYWQNAKEAAATGW